MEHRIDAGERTAFRTCPRQWDFLAATRRNLEPAAAPRTCDREQAVRDAMAVFYFPGMWDWPRPIVLPLVAKGLRRSIDEQRARAEAHGPATGAEVAEWDHRTGEVTELVERYTAWAADADHFAPVLVEAEFEAPVPDARRAEWTLATPTGREVRYAGRADALVIDETDAYWLLRHRVVDEWTPTEALEGDADALAACWAWERYYLGMAITGTVDNELLLGAGDGARPAPPGTAGPAGSGGRVRQHDASGGGRSIPQHRRAAARAAEPDAPDRVAFQNGPGFRRTWIRRSPEDVAAAGAAVAADALVMVDPDVPVGPRPDQAVCGRCAYLRPCLVMEIGGDPAGVLAAHYRPRPGLAERPSRIGSANWGFGRGAAPPTFGR